SAGGHEARGIAQWNFERWRPLNGGTNGFVSSLARMPDGDIIVGGTFTSVDDVSMNRIARWDGRDWWKMGYGAHGPYAQVASLTVLPGGDLIAAGSFETM